jgi:hypothetical protein
MITCILMDSITELPCKRQKCSEHFMVIYDIVIKPVYGILAGLVRICVFGRQKYADLRPILRCFSGQSFWETFPGLVSNQLLTQESIETLWYLIHYNLNRSIINLPPAHSPSLIVHAPAYSAARPPSFSPAPAATASASSASRPSRLSLLPASRSTPTDRPPGARKSISSRRGIVSSSRSKARIMSRVEALRLNQTLRCPSCLRRPREAVVFS